MDGDLGAIEQSAHKHRPPSCRKRINTPPSRWATPVQVMQAFIIAPFKTHNTSCLPIMPPKPALHLPTYPKHTSATERLTITYCLGQSVHLIQAPYALLFCERICLECYPTLSAVEPRRSRPSNGAPYCSSALHRRSHAIMPGTRCMPGSKVKGRVNIHA